MSKQGDIAKEGQGSASGATSQPDAATRDVKAKSSGFELALASVRGLHGPLSAAELTTFRTGVAREYARAEARRTPTPQLDLDQAA